MSPSWSTDSRLGSMPSPSRSIQAIRHCGLLLELDRAVADPGLGDRDLVDPDGAGGVAEVGLGAGRQDPPQHLVGGPLDRRDGGDAEPLVDLGAAGVVDARDDLLDPEGLAGHPRGDDVGVVAAAHGGEGVGPLDAGLGQDGLVEAVAGHLGAVEGRAEPTEGVGVAVDDADGVVAVLEAAGERRADAATAHDHDVHTPHTSGGPAPRAERCALASLRGRWKCLQADPARAQAPQLPAGRDAAAEAHRPSRLRQ